MKTKYLIPFLTFITLASSSHALDLMVVDNYQVADKAEIWNRVKTDQLPSALLANVSIDKPGMPYSKLFPKNFMQESLYVVCHKDCSRDAFREQNGKISGRDLNDKDVIEQSNVYFWLKKYFNFVEEKLHFKTSHYLKIMTNRELRDETKGKKLKNNAFFNPMDLTLSFLPATKNLLFKLLGGKINRSGFDPSVVVHEASHYLFHHLFPDPINGEIGGLNEGFADYMANIFLGSPKIGLVMMQGKSLRDSAQPIDANGKIKSYEPNMEVHDLGERVSYALWKTRELAQDKNEMDRLVMDAIIDMSRNPYSTIHDFKAKMIHRLAQVIHNSDLNEVNIIWEIAFSGSTTKINNLKFLDESTHDTGGIGFKTKQVLPQKLAQEYGTNAVEENEFSFKKIVNISQSQTAILMDSNVTKKDYWIALDNSRSNILGIYDLEKKLLTDYSELKKIRFLAETAKSASEVITDYATKLNAFTALAEGKGDFSKVYKVKDISTQVKQITFNGNIETGFSIKMDLRRKLLTGVLFGLPDIESIELYLLSIDSKLSLPEINGQKVIGYKLTLKTGTEKEVILNKYKD